MVVGVLADDNASLLFGSPVDPSDLPDYLDIIKNPKDLGTILSDIEDSLNGEGPYLNAEQVLQDVQLVWSNALTYNNRPEDKSIVKITKSISKFFKREWQKAGLPSSSLNKAAGGGIAGDGAPSERPLREKGICTLSIIILVL